MRLVRRPKAWDKVHSHIRFYHNGPVSSRLAGQKNTLLRRPRLPAFWFLFWPYRAPCTGLALAARRLSRNMLAEQAHGEQQKQFPPSPTIPNWGCGWKYKAMKSLVLRTKMHEAEVAGGLAD